MLHRITSNNIFFNIEFVQKLMLLIPNKVSNYWGISIIDIDRIEGLIRYNEYDEIDAIYIFIKTKFMEIDYIIPQGIIKFSIEKGIFTFDSIYSQYDPIEEKVIYPYEEYRYDSDMNIISKYEFITEAPAAIDVEILPICIQYKNGKKLKEYFTKTEMFPLSKLNELDNAGIIKQEVKAEKDIIINCLIVYGEPIKHYHIK